MEFTDEASAKAALEEIESEVLALEQSVRQGIGTVESVQRAAHGIALKTARFSTADTHPLPLGADAKELENWRIRADGAAQALRQRAEEAMRVASRMLAHE